MSPSVEQANATLFGFTDVVDFRLTLDPEEGSYTFLMTLRNEKQEELELSFKDVSGGLKLPFGGRLSQFMALWITDVRSLQWDRVNFELRDREHEESIFLRCSAFSLKKL